MRNIIGIHQELNSAILGMLSPGIKIFLTGGQYFTTIWPGYNPEEVYKYVNDLIFQKNESYGENS